MNFNELYKAKDKNLAASWYALKRAAELARQVAIQTNTAIIIVKDGQLVRLTAEQLRQDSECRHEP